MKQQHQSLLGSKKLSIKLTSIINELPGGIYWKDAAEIYLGNNLQYGKNERGGFVLAIDYR